MQKVEGSSPFSRFTKAPQTQGFPANQSAEQHAFIPSGQAVGQGAVEQPRAMNARAALVITRRRFLACSASVWDAANPRLEVARS